MYFVNLLLFVACAILTPTTAFFPFQISSNVSLDNLGVFVSPPIFIPTAKDGTKCQKQSQQYREAFYNKELWAIKMHDANGKLPSGLLNGNVHAFGDFWQCVKIKSKEKSPNQIVGKYCQVDAYIEISKDFPDSTLVEVLDLMTSHKAIQSNYFDGVKFFPSFTPITWGFCVPDGCSHKDVEDTLQASLEGLNKTQGLTVRLKSTTNSCDMDRPSSFHQGNALPTMILLWTILGLSISGAILEAILPVPESAENSIQNKFWFKLITAFSLKRNWNTLTTMETTGEDISCVHGVRFVFSMSIYLLHRGVFGMFVPFSNRTEIADILEGEWTMIFRAFWNNVDAFVVLSGLLTSYFSFKKLQDGKNLNVLAMYAQRYYKFTPMYVITILILKNLAIEMRTGPNALRVVKHFVTSCENNLWKTFFYLGNLDGINEMCYPPAHQLITDMQMYLLAPAVVAILWKFSNRGVASIFSVIALLTAYKGYAIYTYNMGSFIYYGASLEEMLTSANQMYLNPLHRLTPYLLGMLLGYFMRSHGQHIKLTQRRVNIGHFLAISAGYYSFFGPKHVAHRSYVFDAKESALFGMVQPILGSSALCWVIFICNAGRGGVINKFLSWKGFIIFTRLSYSFYLTQILVIFFGIAGSNGPEYMRMHQIIDLNELSMVLIMSITFTLLFLLPLGELYNIAVQKSTKATKIENPLMKKTIKNK